jgi:hypothetical protein
MLECAASADEMSPDQLEALGEEIATFAARIDVAEHALLTRLRVFDAYEAWAQAGAISCAHWVSWRIGVGLKAAREKVRVARALGGLHEVDALFRRGALSYSKVRAITRVASPATEQDFIDVALHSTAAQLERMSRSYQRSLELRDAPSEAPRSQRRFVRRVQTPGGMVRIEIQLPPEEAAVVWDAVVSAADAGPDKQASAEESRETSGEASAGARGPEAANDSEALELRRADAILDVARAYLQLRPRTLGSGYELVMLTSKEQLARGHAGVGGFLRDGTPVPLHVAQMLACDSARLEVAVGEQGELLDIGRRTRSIPSAIGRALWLRDGGCRVPGCGRKQHLHAHHIQAWAEGGQTKLANLVLVCPGHHRMIHEGSLRAELRGDNIIFVDQRGRDMPSVPRVIATGKELEALEQFLNDEHLHIDASTNEPKWDGVPMDLADTLAWMLMAEPDP